MKSLFKHLFHKEKGNEETDRNKIKFYAEDDDTNFIVEDTYEARSVEDILKNICREHSYLGIELIARRNKQSVGKRKLEPFEIPALLHKEYQEDDKIEVRFFIYDKKKKKKTISRKSMLTKFSVKKETKVEKRDEVLYEKSLSYRRSDSENLKEVKVRVTKHLLELHELKKKNQVTHLHFLLMNDVVIHESDPCSFYIKTDSVKYIFVCKSQKDCTKIYELLKEQTSNVHLTHLMQDLKFKITDTIQQKTEKLFSLKQLSKHAVFENKAYRRAIFDDLIRSSDITVCDIIETFITSYEENKETKMDNCIHQLIKRGVIKLSELLLLNNRKSLKNSIIHYIEQKEREKALTESDILKYYEISKTESRNETRLMRTPPKIIAKRSSDLMNMPMNFDLKLGTSESMHESLIYNDQKDAGLTLKKSLSCRVESNDGIKFIRNTFNYDDDEIDDEKITELVKSLDHEQIKSFIEENNVKRDTMFYKFCFDKICDFLISNTNHLRVIDLYLQRAFKKVSFVSEKTSMSVFTDANSII